MPGAYYWEGLDNFFYKVTQMESPRKNNDCYFYYYSTCTKGDSCSFRHEPTALGCETVCSFWQQGKCINQHCNLRHMELRKNRKVIPCYWETQPGGCLKPHCPFLHKVPKGDHADNSSKLNESNDVTKTQDKTDIDQWNRRTGASNEAPECLRQANEVPPYPGPAVDPLVVNFEEESDNESLPTVSPKKPAYERIKTLEQIRLEKIQAESAAFYNYFEENSNPFDTELTQTANDLRKRLIKRMDHSRTSEEPRNLTLNEIRQSRKRKSEPFIQKNENSKSSDFKILTLDEIRAAKKRLSNSNQEIDSSTNDEISSKICNIDSSKDSDFKILTLDEIRARKKRLANLDQENVCKMDETVNDKNGNLEIENSKVGEMLRNFEDGSERLNDQSIEDSKIGNYLEESNQNLNNPSNIDTTNTALDVNISEATNTCNNVEPTPPDNETKSNQRKNNNNQNGKSNQIKRKLSEEELETIPVKKVCENTITSSDSDIQVTSSSVTENVDSKVDESLLLLGDDDEEMGDDDVLDNIDDILND